MMENTTLDIDTVQIANAFQKIIAAIGEDPQREGLVKTPQRVARMYKELFSGLYMQPDSFLDVTFHEDSDDVVLVRDIPFYSMCEHHFLPFYGKAHIAYLPREGKVVGISKLARITEAFARRPQLQERLTRQIADCLYQNPNLQPQGVMVIVEAEHMCMSMRGIQKPGTFTVTSAARGSFAAHPEARSELLSLLRQQK